VRDKVAAEFRLVNDQVVLFFNCPKDGQIKQAHYDNIFTKPARI